MGWRSLTSSSKITAAQVKVLREERTGEAAAALPSDSYVDGPYFAPQMKTTIPGPKSRVRHLHNSVYKEDVMLHNFLMVTYVRMCTNLQHTFRGMATYSLLVHVVVNYKSEYSL